MDALDISIVVPAYNEEQRLGRCLGALVQFCKGHFRSYEIIVVDDGSYDKTEAVAKRYRSHHVRILRNARNHGKGYAVRQGILAARYPLLLFSDADLATPIRELSGMLQWMQQGFDIVIASRNLKGSRLVVKQAFYRRLMGRAFPVLVQLLLLPGLKDTQCGFKLFRTGVARELARLQRLNGFAFDVELLYLARQRGYAVKEVPVKWIDQEGSKVRLVHDAFAMLSDVLRIRSMHSRGFKGKKGRDARGARDAER